MVQATVIRVARKIDGFKTDPRHGSFKSWLLGQARWRIGDQFRALKRESQLSGGTAKGASDPSVGARDDDTRTDPTNCLPYGKLCVPQAKDRPMRQKAVPGRSDAPKAV